jgi:hypothetical protein
VIPLVRELVNEGTASAERKVAVSGI